MIIMKKKWEINNVFKWVYKKKKKKVIYKKKKKKKKKK
jgi:hypothetical protein